MSSVVFGVSCNDDEESDDASADGRGAAAGPEPSGSGALGAAGRAPLPGGDARESSSLGSWSIAVGMGGHKDGVAELMATFFTPDFRLSR